ncbi:Clr5 domain-containing protein [Xylariaceae sp. FL0016]|nr:Clr5 domain-containing protein [Xylariaceae sp. FL0016]
MGPFQPSAAWELQKEEIRRLYIDQNKRLREVIAIMKSRGFVATPRMYKAKFEAWGFSKNNKERDVSIMLQLQRLRAVQGKSTVFTRHGKVVDLSYYLERKGNAPHEVIEPNDGILLPHYLKARTPSPEPMLKLPPHLRVPDILISFLKYPIYDWNRNHSRESFEKASDMYIRGEVNRAIWDYNTACRFWTTYNTHATLLGQRAFQSLHLLVKDPSAFGIIHMLISLVISPHQGLATELWKYLSAYAKIVAPTSALCALFTTMREFANENYDDAGIGFFLSCIDTVANMCLGQGGFALAVASSIGVFFLCDTLQSNSTKRPISSPERMAATTIPTQRFCGSDYGLQDIELDIPQMWDRVLNLWRWSKDDKRAAQISSQTLKVLNDPLTTADTAASQRTKRSGDEHISDPQHATLRKALQNTIDAAEVHMQWEEPHLSSAMQTLESWYLEVGDKF